MISYRAAIVERHRRAQEARRANMIAEAGRLAALAASRFVFRRLCLYGSVADGRPLSVWSDLDLAIEGLPPDRLDELAAVLAEKAVSTIDVKPFELLPSATQESIARRGVLLYEQS